MVAPLKRNRNIDSEEDDYDFNDSLHVSNKRRSRRKSLKNYAESNSEDPSELDDFGSESNFDLHNTPSPTETELENSAYLITLRIGKTAARSISEHVKQTASNSNFHSQEEVKENKSEGDQNSSYIIHTGDQQDETLPDNNNPDNSNAPSNFNHDQQSNVNYGEDDTGKSSC